MACPPMGLWLRASLAFARYFFFFSGGERCSSKRRRGKIAATRTRVTHGGRRWSGGETAQEEGRESAEERKQRREKREEREKKKEKRSRSNRQGERGLVLPKARADVVISSAVWVPIPALWLRRVELDFGYLLWRVDLEEGIEQLEGGRQS